MPKCPKCPETKKRLRRETQRRYRAKLKEDEVRYQAEQIKINNRRRKRLSDLKKNDIYAYLAFRIKENARYETWKEKKLNEKVR